MKMNGVKVCTVLVLMPVLTFASSWKLSDQAKKDIGFTALQELLGGDMPTGVGLSATMVEALDGGNYRVDEDDPLLDGRKIEFLSGGSVDPSPHATRVAKFFFGDNSLSPDIGLDADGQDIGNYEAGNWAQSGFLRFNTSQLPMVESRDLVNHSWAGSFGDTDWDTDILRRIDYAIQRDGFVAVYGMNYGASPGNLMWASYNGIAVGESSGNHSSSNTTIDGVGRIKPDLVVPVGATSHAAPSVAGAAGLLIETARNTQGLENGDRSVVVKSVLLSGASREGDHVPFTWSADPEEGQPLDNTYGAGQLNIYQSYHILTAGQFEASETETVESTGWDFGTASASGPKYYYFDVDAETEGGPASFALTWHRDIIATAPPPGPPSPYTFDSILANLDLHLYEADGFVVGDLLSESVSGIDNVELLYLSGLAAGRYAIGVSSDTNDVEYGLSWQVIPEPSGVLLALLAGAVFTIRRRVKQNRRGYESAA